MDNENLIIIPIEKAPGFYTSHGDLTIVFLAPGEEVPAHLMD